MIEQNYAYFLIKQNDSEHSLVLIRKNTFAFICAEAGEVCRYLLYKVKEREKG